MSYKLLAFIVAILSAFPIADALQDNILVYTIVDGDAIVSHTLSFSEDQDGLRINIPLDSEAIEVKGPEFSVIKGEDSKTILLKEPTRYAEIKYITGNLIEKTKDQFFIVNLAGIDGDKDVTAILPEGATLKYRLDSPQSSIIPSTQDITTDGKSIKIRWDKDILADANSLLVMYDEQPEGVGAMWVIISAAAVLLMTITFVAYRRLISRGPSSKRKVKEDAEEVKKDSEEDDTPKGAKEEVKKGFPQDLTRNLFEEEKAIVEALLKAKDNELWQKALVFETGISKVKLSRKLRALEHKGIVEKIPFGNTNKIRLKR